jgi:hypothetical protein
VSLTVSPLQSGALSGPQQLSVPDVLLVARLFQSLPKLVALKLAAPAAVVFAAIRFWCVSGFARKVLACIARIKPDVISVGVSVDVSNANLLHGGQCLYILWFMNCCQPSDVPVLAAAVHSSYH